MNKSIRQKKLPYSQTREGEPRHLIVETCTVTLERGERYEHIRLPKGDGVFRYGKYAKNGVPWTPRAEGKNGYVFTRCVIVTERHYSVPHDRIVIDAATRSPVVNPDGTYVRKTVHEQRLELLGVEHAVMNENGAYVPA